MGAFRKSTRVPCPECGRGPRDDTAVYTHDERGYVWFCHRCGASGTNQLDGADEPRELPPRPSLDAVVARFLRARVIEPGSPAASYLQARGCVLPPPDGHLRWVERARHPSGYVGPALLALGTLAETHTQVGVIPQTIHTTWIQPDGLKAPVMPNRMFAAGCESKDVVCRLWPDWDVTLGLGVAEGIETALSLAHGFTPVWAMLCAHTLSRFSPLDGIEAITIAVDDDEAGRKAATSCWRLWHAAGKEARCVKA